MASLVSSPTATARQLAWNFLAPMREKNLKEGKKIRPLDTIQNTASKTVLDKHLRFKEHTQIIEGFGEDVGSHAVYPTVFQYVHPYSVRAV